VCRGEGVAKAKKLLEVNKGQGTARSPFRMIWQSGRSFKMELTEVYTPDGSEIYWGMTLDKPIYFFATGRRMSDALQEVLEFSARHPQLESQCGWAFSLIKSRIKDLES
jgi:hypothetical protein